MITYKLIILAAYCLYYYLQSKKNIIYVTKSITCRCMLEYNAVFIFKSAKVVSKATILKKLFYHFPLKSSVYISSKRNSVDVLMFQTRQFFSNFAKRFDYNNTQGVNVKLFIAKCNI